MTRWMVFDHASLDIVVTASPETAELHSGGDALRAALAAPQDAVLLMPAATPDRVLVAQLRRRRASPQVPAYEAVGFLGLRDAPVYLDEPAPPKKWWQRVFG